VYACSLLPLRAASQVTGLDIDGDGEKGAGLVVHLENLTGVDLDGLCPHLVSVKRHGNRTQRGVAMLLCALVCA
jgi:hypothetical protein